MRLRLRLVVAMTIVALLPLLLTGWFATDIAVSENQRNSDERLLRDASAIAQVVESWVVAQRDALEGWTVPFAVGENPALQRGLLAAILQANPSFVSVVLVDRDNVEVVEPLWVDAALAGVDGRRTIGSVERARALVGKLPSSAAIEQHDASAARDEALPIGGAVGGAWRFTPDATPSVPLAVVGPRDPGLVFGAELSLSEVAKLIASQSTEDHRVSVVGSEGQVILGDGTGAESLAKLGSDATVAFVLPDGTPVRGAIAVVATPDWRVITIEPAAAAQAAGSAIRLRTGQILVVSLLLALAVGAVIARSLSEPVRELSDGALRVADGDYGRKLPEDRGDEIGDLQRAFNHMSARLANGRDEIARQRAEIESFNRELQARVDERTRELVEAQARLVQSGQLAAVAEMGAGLAHELNNPIAAILGTAQVVRMRLRGTPDEERVARIEEQAERCREVVASMLRLSEGSSEAVNEPGSVDVIDLRGMLAEVAALVAAPFRQRGVTLVVESADQPVKASANPVATSRVIAQILQSFRSGLPDGARLVVRACVVDGRAAVSFEPDRVVAKGSARDDWMASGMSLWVARQQLETMNGRLDEPGSGQTAWVLSLPWGTA